MARTWLSVTVELLGGRGEELWPWPGRIFAVGPSHTFKGFADAINAAFARWDRSHLSMFTLADGRVVTDAQTGAEMAASSGGPVITAIDLVSARVARTVELGAEFQFTFDLGDDWTHRCVVGTEKIDPTEVLGVRPDVPLPYWGWGAIPDQYGRRWADDGGEGRPPRRPPRPHPMLLHAWPDRQQIPTLDLTELRQAIAAQDADRILGAVSGHDIDDVLQQVGAGVPLLLGTGDERAELMAVSVINRLTWRAWVGDEVLAADLLACLRGEPTPGRVVPVDLEMLSVEMEGDTGMSSAGHLDLRTGQVYSDAATDPMMVGEDAAIDVEDEPDRWLHVDQTSSHDRWQDMAAFAERQRDDQLRTTMQQAIEGNGAFRRFRDLIHDEDVAESWHAFSTDRQLGRARAFLADQGIHVGQPPPTPRLTVIPTQQPPRP
jgi:hypothetical protein